MDPISDMLTEIRNAQAARKEAVSLPFSSLKYEIAKILGKEGFVGKVEKKKKKVDKNNRFRLGLAIEIEMKYDNGFSATAGFKRVSKPGQRIYQPYCKIKKVKQGYGIAIISTSKGLMTDKEARKKKLGGEIICQAW